MKQLKRSRGWALALAAISLCGAAVVWMLWDSLVLWPLSWDVPGSSGRLESLMAGQRLTSARVSVALAPERGVITCTAELEVRSPDGPLSRIHFLLNPGLRVHGVLVNGREARAIQSGNLVRIRPPMPIGGGESAQVRVTYGGRPGKSLLSNSWFTDDEIVLPGPSFWYPCDLQSFHTLEVSTTLPTGFEAAFGADAIESSQPDRSVLRTWKESRPVLTGTFAAGRFERTARMQGDVYCTILTPREHASQAGNLLDAAGSAHNFFTSWLGDDSFSGLTVVISREADFAFNGGNAVIVLPERTQADGQDSFGAIAGLVSRNWWGGTVSGRWLTDRPEGSLWLVEGLAEYSSWLAIEQRHGKRALARHIETIECAATMSQPMKALSLIESSRAESDETIHQIRVRGAFVARMLSAMIGNEAFLAGLRNFLSIHHYSTVSLESLRQEFELASNRDLSEFFRIWFDRPGTFDYAISEASVRNGQLNLAVENPGNIPAMMDLDVAIVADEGVAIHSVEVGAGGASYTLPVHGEVRRVVLDPYFIVGDMRRANNVWPRRQWPLGISVGGGRIAWWMSGDWPHRLSAQIQTPSKSTATLDVLETADGLAQPPIWNESGDVVAILALDEHSPRAYLWSPDSNAHEELPDGMDALVGWTSNGELAAFTRQGTPRWNLIDGAGDMQTVKASAMPAPGTIRTLPGTEVFVYQTAQPRSLRILDPVSGTDTEPFPELRPVCVAWPKEDEIVCMDESGTLARGNLEKRWLEPLMELSYAVHRAAISPNGGNVAWIDPANRLRIARTKSPVPRYIPIEGEVIDFAWESDGSLVYLEATPPQALPMLFHADYELYRVDAESLTPIEIDMGGGTRLRRVRI